MEPDVRHIAKTDWEKHRVVRSDGEVTIDGVYPEREKGSYMVRVRVPGGLVTFAQARALAAFASDYANGEWHVDTRANVEFHGAPEDKLLAFIEAIETTGLTTRGACGDSVRNIVLGSETTGAGGDRLQAVVDDLTRRFAGRPEFETLPRKFKAAFYAADDREPLHRINDLGFVEEQAEGELAFSVWIGGGLGREPRLADLLFARVPAAEVPALLEAAVQVHNEWGNRKNRAKARFKYVLLDLGLARVRELVLQRYQPAATVDTAPHYSPAALPPRFSTDGIHAQGDGGFRVRVPIVAGDITGREVIALADAAERAGATHLQISVRQNIAIANVPPAGVPALVRALEALGYPPSGWSGPRDIVACPGATSCRKGFVETHDFARELSAALDNSAAPAWAKRLRVSVSGCPNSCSHPQLFDLGFRGNAGRARGQTVKGYDLLVGGRLYGRTLLGRQAGTLLGVQDVLATAVAAVEVLGQWGRVEEPFDALLDRVGLRPFVRELRRRVTLTQGEWVQEPEVPRKAPRNAQEAAELSRLLEALPPREIVHWALDVYGDELLFSTALNAGGVLLLQYFHDAAPAHPAWFIDTGKHFAETLAYRDLLRERFDFFLRTAGPGFSEPEFSRDYGPRLWSTDPNLCCAVRKVAVMAGLRQGKRAWVSALRREQGGERADVPVLEFDADGLLKIQPLATATRGFIDAELADLGLPQHPLRERGFRSIGCEPCTAAAAEGADERAGRWAGTTKTECGLHTRRRQEVQS
ncbi:MAG: phosphoadenylyl-sulfate reductase [Planctomycetes bacterium]|nr:phosphoadenylyl-sulfate reductase [Planctomycetota bacterium]